MMMWKLNSVVGEHGADMNENSDDDHSDFRGAWDGSRWNEDCKGDDEANAAGIVLKQENGGVEPTTTSDTLRTEEEVEEEKSTWIWSAYKFLPSSASSQSALNAVACLIVVFITNLWACLQTQLLSSKWIQKVCAKTEEFLEFANYTNQPFEQVVERNQLDKQELSTSSSNGTIDIVDSSAPGNKEYLSSVQTGTNNVSRMTIEVPAESMGDALHPPSLPVLRINSLSVEDPTLDSSQFILSSAPSSDGEDLMYPDSAIYTDGELSSSGENGIVVSVSSQLMRRDSDTSDVSSTDGSVDDGNKEPHPEIVTKIINQVEYLFSDDHLAKDGFLLKHVRRRSDGFVSLKLVAGLRKVKQISREFPVILTSLKTSEKLEVNPEGTKIRRVDPLSPQLKSLPISSQNKEKLSKSPSSSGDDLPMRNSANGCIHASTNFPVTIEKENKQRGGGKSNKVTRKESVGGQKEQNNRKQSASNRNHQNNANNTVSNNEREIGLRRRGGSLPIPMMTPGAGILSTQNVYYPNSPGSPTNRFHRQTIAYLSPNASPPNAPLPTTTRPKSNSYCEGLMTSATMSPWLQRRKAASRTSSVGNVVLSAVIRQPRGPDGTRGFAPGPRLIEAN